jgi:hypothetical protein
MAEGFAKRLREENQDKIKEQVIRAYELAYGRKPDPEEIRLGLKLSEDHGLQALCRVLFNSNEFVVID